MTIYIVLWPSGASFIYRDLSMAIKMCSPKKGDKLLIANTIDMLEVLP